MLTKKIACSALMLFVGSIAFGETTEVVAEAPSRSVAEVLGLPADPILVALLAAVIVLFLVALYLRGTYLSLYKEIFGRQAVPVAEELSWKKVVSTMNEAVPVEQEHTILTDHEYDGIRELDNNLPLWWRYMFYGTIAFSFIYLFRYHIFRSGDLPEAEYRKEVAAAEVQKEEYRKKDAANVDEKNVVALTDESSVATGKAIFSNNCIACHGGAGEGGVGPNLTDDYWLHGGSIADVFKSIKFGIPEKGMISWQAQLKPKQIQEVASFILTLKGTKPANAKAPQGDLYKAGDAAPADTAAVAAK